MAKNWIKGATANSHGQFRRKAEAAGETTREFASEHAGDGGKLGKQARLAKVLMGMHAEGGLVGEHAKGGEVKHMAAKPKHKFQRGHTMPPRGAPMRAEEAANTAGDPQQAEMPPPGAQTAVGPAPGAMPAAMPAQAKGGSVSKVAPVSRMSKMYGPKRVSRSAA